MRVCAEHARDLDEFDHIDAPLAGFDASDKGMRSFQPTSKVALGQLRFFSGRNKEFDQESMSTTSECLPQRCARHGALLAKWERHK